MSDEDWVRAAMEDEYAVVELLMSLRRPAPPKRESRSLAMPFEWSVRQRRSKPTLHAAKKKEKPTPTASPTTPLSWSGATSVSGSGADGFEESSRPPPKLPEASRSKVRFHVFCLLLHRPSLFRSPANSESDCAVSCVCLFPMSGTLALEFRGVIACYGFSLKYP
ncbi:hypothetical protein Acr_16g0006660 [Actinidia rufa]|uniref:Uncharacterized protein n=1 Tax=Actinidia rufa TaxID=165716 RepID=A0A7J0FZB3_9ERIC|nr:hypothetical protein Acr_16g0006660 [Actinidia rufa]